MANLDLATLMVKIEADGSQAISEMNKVGDASKTQSSKVNKDWADAGKTLTDIGGKLSMAISVPLAAAGTACVKLASDLTETLGKTEVVFGDMADTVIQWSETSVDCMGLAQETALNMASTYGDLGTSMGLTTNQAANMSMNMVQLAADMASFKNISIERANVALQAVYTGETESLKAMGIVMTEANLEQFAMAEGCDKTYKAMSQTEKVMLRYRYVMSMTTNAQGDFVRTGDSLANQTRKLGQNIKELGASFGKILEPAITGIVAAANDVVSWFRNMSDTGKRVVITIAEIAAGIPALLAAVGGIITIIGKLKSTLALLTANPIVATIAAITTGVVALTAIFSNLTNEVDKSTDTYQRFKASFDEAVKARIDTSDIDELNGKEVDIEIDANIQSALDKAQALITDIKNNYAGSIAIDGDTTAANDALDELQAAIDAAEAFLKVGGDAKEAEAVRKGLVEAINKSKGIVGVGANADEVNALLDELRGTAINISASIAPADDYETTINELKEKAEALRGEYTAIGVFEIGENTEDNITEYQNLLAEATIAVTGFDEKVSNLDAITDRMAAEQKAAVITKMLADSMAIYASYLAGTISHEQYTQGMAKVATEAQNAIVGIDANTAAIKENNAAFNDGKIDTVNWGETYAASMSLADSANSQVTISTEQAAASIAALADGTGTAMDAGVAWAAIQQESAANAELAAQAELKYQETMESANSELERTTQLQTTSRDLAQSLSGAYQSIQGAMMGGASASEALNTTLQAYPELAGELIEQTGASVDKLDPAAASARAAAEGDDELGEAAAFVAEQMEKGVSPTEALVSAMEKFPDVAGKLPTALNASFETTNSFYTNCLELQMTTEEEVAESTKQLEQAQKDYETKTKTAHETYTTEMGNITTTYTAEEVAAIGKMCQDSGLELSEAEIEAQTTTTAMMEGMTKAVKDGSPEVVDEVHNCVGDMIDEADKLEDGGKDSGKNLIAGMVSGMESGEGKLYSTVKRIVNKAISEAKKAASIHSPSRKTRDLIGKPFVQGIEVGMNDYMPTLLKSTKRNTEAIISAGTGVINSDYKLRPANTTNIARQGNTTINQTNNFTSRTLSPYEQQQQIRKLNKDLSGVFA